MENNSGQPLLSPAKNESIEEQYSAASFITDEDDIPPITGMNFFFQQLWIENKKLLYLAAPAMFTTLCLFSLGATTQTFAGHVGTLELAAFSVENSVFAGFCYVICMELWYYVALVLVAGYLKNTTLGIDALSVCVNILEWAGMLSLGLNVAVSVRVSNELGAGHPRTAKLSVVAVCVCAFVMGVAIAIIITILRKQYPSLFAESIAVQKLVYDLAPLLALCLAINNVQPALSEVAIGAGWQAIVAYVNVATDYLFGIPLGLILAYKLKWGVQGIWCGMIGGTLLQTLIIILALFAKRIGIERVFGNSLRL